MNYQEDIFKKASVIIIEKYEKYEDIPDIYKFLYKTYIHDTIGKKRKNINLDE